LYVEKCFGTLQSIVEEEGDAETNKVNSELEDEESEPQLGSGKAIGSIGEEGWWMEDCYCCNSDNGWTSFDR
jgi:hypothetical protein